MEKMTKKEIEDYLNVYHKRMRNKTQELILHPKLYDWFKEYVNTLKK